VYAFRRPITKAEPQWVACTAEEAAANPLESEWLSGGIIWTECESYLDEGKLDKIYPYRTTTALPEYVQLSGDSPFLGSRELDKALILSGLSCQGGLVLRSTIHVGTVLG
jgi:hypothetical protein